MSMTTVLPPRRPPPAAVVSDIDHRIVLQAVSWCQFETFVAIRGDAPVPRLKYLKGRLELMSPSWNHEAIKSSIGRLVEAYADERGIDVNAYGAWLLKDAPKDAGAEPDECYVVGSTPRLKDRPDFAIEVVWTSGGIDKLAVYRALGVREVWVWIEGRIDVFLLRGEGYDQVSRSLVLPELDLDLLATFLSFENQSEAVREYRKALRSRAPAPG